MEFRDVLERHAEDMIWDIVGKWRYRKLGEVTRKGDVRESLKFFTA